MKFKIEQSELKKLLAYLTSNRKGKDVLPLEIAVEDDMITLQCLTPTIFLFATAKCNSITDGSARLDGVLLNTIIKGLPAGTVTLSGKKRIRISHDAKSKVRNVQTLSEDFEVIVPKVGDELEFEVNLKEFLAVMGTVKFAVGTDPNRPVLQNFYFSDKINAVVACDSLRAAYAILDTKLTTSFSLPSFVLPLFKALTKLKVTAVTIRCGSMGWLEFDAGSYKMRTATYSGDYPTAAVTMAETVPAQPHATTVYLPREEWLSMLRMANTYAEQAAKAQVSQALTINIGENEVSFDMAVSNVGDMKDTIRAEVIGEPMAIAVHPSLLLQAVSNCAVDKDDKAFSLHVWSSEKPFMLQHEGWMFLMAPMSSQPVARVTNTVAAKVRQENVDRPPWEVENDASEGDF